MKLRQQDIATALKVLYHINRDLPQTDDWKATYHWLGMLLNSFLLGDTDDKGFIDLYVKGWEKIYEGE